MRHSQNLDLVDPTRPLSLPSVMDSAETTWTLLTPPLPSQTPSTLLTCPLTDPPVSSVCHSLISNVATKTITITFQLKEKVPFQTVSDTFPLSLGPHVQTVTLWPGDPLGV